MLSGRGGCRPQSDETHRAAPRCKHEILPADFAHAEACEGIHSPASPGPCRTCCSVSPFDRDTGPDSLHPPSQGIADLCTEQIRRDRVSCHCQAFMHSHCAMCWLTPTFHFFPIHPQQRHIKHPDRQHAQLHLSRGALRGDFERGSCGSRYSLDGQVQRHEHRPGVGR